MAEILNLTADRPERPEIILPDGSRCTMRLRTEFSLCEMRWAEKQLSKDSSMDDISCLMKMMLVDITDEQINELSVDQLERIVNFFLEKEINRRQMKSPKQSRKPKDSMEEARKTG